MNRRQTAAVAAALLGIAGILAAVGGPAAFASYHHAYQVFVTFNEDEGRAAWLPLTTDGMLAAALVVMYSRRWAGQRVGGIPWLAFVVGFSGTIAANLASANAFGAPTVGEGIGRLCAAVWAPISFAVTLELVAVMLGKVRDYVTRTRSAGVDTWPVTWKIGIPEYPYPYPAPTGPDRYDEGYTAGTLAAAAAARTAAADREAAADRFTAATLAAGPPPAQPVRPARAKQTGTPGPDRTAEPTGTPDRSGTNGRAVRWTEQDEAVRMDLQNEADQTGTVPTVRSVRDRFKMGADRAAKIHARLTVPQPQTVPADGGTES
jgi:hypothetical protein